jgi:3-methyladenine DNA glycosylase AlkD
MTLENLKKEFLNLGQNYKTKDVDRLNKRLIKEKQDVSVLKDICLIEQQYHRTYFQVSLGLLNTIEEQYKFIEDNFYLLSDWWHVDQLTQFLKPVDLDFAYEKAKEYIYHPHPFARRWGYVMFIQKLGRSSEKNLEKILSLLKNDAHYTNQMAQGWLICELAIFFPERILEWFKISNNLDYRINSKAIQKISDSFRIKECVKEEFKALRPMLKNKGETK